MTRQYDNATDLITFSRSSKGTALRKVAYGPELNTDVNFESGVGIFLASTGSVVWNGSSITSTKNSAGITAMTSSDVLEAGKAYYIEFTIDSLNPSYTHVDSPIGEITSGAGTYSGVFVASNTAVNFGQNNGGNTSAVTYSNISIKEVTFDQGDLTLFNHPADIPRIEYDASGNVLGLLVEEARTNLVTYSEDFSQASWIKLGAGVASGAVVTGGFEAPTGTNTATRLQCNLNGGTTISDQSLIYDDVVGTGNHSISFWVKSNTGSNQTFAFGNTLTFYATGVATDEWQRFTFSGNLTVNRNIFIGTRGTLGSDDTLDILIYGAQLEAGAFPTSYIPTSGATATRAADVASIPVSAFGYNQEAGTVVVEYDAKYDSGPVRIVELEDTITDRITLYEGNDGSPAYVFVRKNNVTQATVQTANSAQVGFDKIAVSATADDTRICLNGGTVAEDTSTDMPLVATLLMGQSTAGGRLNGHIKSLRYIPRRLTNSQLVEITS